MAASGCSGAAPGAAPAPRARGNPRMAARVQAAEAVRPLQQTMPPVRPGEWRSYWHENDEPPQTYAASRPAVADERRTTLYVQPLGNFTPREKAAHDLLPEFLRLYFGTPVKMLPPLSAADIPAKLLRWQHGKAALRVVDYTDRFLKQRLPGDGWGLMTVTALDLFKSEAITGLYGDTLLFGRAGVISWHHLQGDLSLMLKGVAHESAHMLTLRHCQHYLCNMNGRITLDEFHRSPLWLCPECLAKLGYAVESLDYAARARGLADFCGRLGLAREADYYRRAAAALAAGGAGQ